MVAESSMEKEESQAPVDPPTAQVPLLPLEKGMKDDVLQNDLAVNGFSPKAIDPSKGPVGSLSKKKGKERVKWWYFKNLFHTFPSDSSLSEFKNAIFTKVDGLKAGLGSIKKLVRWQIYIVENYRWGKGMEIMLDSDKQLHEYFKDTLEHMHKPRGLIMTMVQQSGPGIDEEDLALEQHCLMAKNAELGLNTSVSDLVDLTPQSVELDHAKGTPNVDLESPPTHLPGSVWESLKRSLADNAPKGPKKFERLADYRSNSLKTLTSRGKITRSDLSNLMPFPPLYEYLKFSNVPDISIPDILTILEDHGIHNWMSFLKAHWLDPE
ncbi:hypothetical protein CROQUDRAFT_97633 [Cronartium quercuum f. sp. fusiforme G11]|uniref:Uncharacterized protein n=1 Tax=Cronartium quercuum f. sp. fusiforme G11 TaxID=708437 RepID=A0A9P6T9B3_9BASI|nr:hypothetical protein CROQUDRAFT_97633 [Cronartium quercuum f. sp. fusiforme G11]